MTSCHFFLADQIGEPVGTEQQHIAGLGQGAAGVVRLPPSPLTPTARVIRFLRGCFSACFRGDLAALHKLLHHGVVLGEPDHPPARRRR